MRSNAEANAEETKSTHYYSTQGREEVKKKEKKKVSSSVFNGKQILEKEEQKFF